MTQKIMYVKKKQTKALEMVVVPHPVAMSPLHGYIHTYIHTYIQYIYTYIHACMHAYIHTWILIDR